MKTRVSTESNPRTARYLIFGVAGLTLVLFAGFAVAFGIRSHHDRLVKDQTGESADAAVTVDVVEVRPTAENYPLTLPGQTAGWYQSPLYARVDGYVKSWNPNFGDRVKEGDVLATIETPELDQQLVAAKAKTTASDAQINVAESNVSIAKLTYERWKNALPGEVSDQEREQKKADLDAANARLAAARAQSLLDQADVSRYTAMAGFRVLRAPYDGIITKRLCDIGNLVTAGSSGNTSPLYMMAQYDKQIRVLVDVPQKAAVDMVPGLAAQVTSDQYVGRVFQGKVARSAMYIDSQTRTMQVEVDIPNTDLALVPGTYVKVTFDLNQRGLLEVPAAAILYKPGRLQVAVVGSDGRVDFRDVTIARDNGEIVELASGIQPGDRVALNISTAIVQGEQVKTEPADAESGAPAAMPTMPAPMPSHATDIRPPVLNGEVHPAAPVIGPSGPAPGHEPASPPINTAPVNKPGGGVGGD